MTRSTSANQPELPAVGLGVKDHQDGTVDSDYLVDFGVAHVIAASPAYPSANLQPQRS